MGTERPQPPSPAEASNGSAKPSAKEAAGTTKMDSRERSSFRNGILQGRHVDAGNCHVDSEDDLQSIRFLIYQQKYLELLEQRKVQEALQCLRTELATSRPDPKRLHTLTSFIMCGDTADLYKRAHWDGAAGESRRQLLRSLQMFISPTLLLPEDRLEVLLAQAVNQQISTCMYHNTREEMPSLFEDHTCSRDLIPRETRQTLEAHTDEDTTVIVWEVDLDSPSYEIRQLHTLRGHQEALSFVSWSPDDTMLLSCGNDFAVKLIAEGASATSLCLSSDSRHLLVNISNQAACQTYAGPNANVQEIHAWDLKERKLIQKYRGQKRALRHPELLRGTGQAFVISGSEDSQVYIWHRQNGALLEALPGHSGTVNAVSWNPKNPHMFASASDDHTVRVWGLSASAEDRWRRRRRGGP
eukprot:tig00021176_g19187.t1